MSNLSYNELKEAFERTKNIEATKIKEDYSNISILHPQPGDIVVAYLNFNEINIEQAADMHRCLTEVMPDEVSVVTVPDAASLIAYNSKQFTTEMFNAIERCIGREEYIKVLKNELDRIDGDDLK